MIKKSIFLVAALFVVLVGFLIANTFFDQPLKPEVKAILSSPPAFEGPCADARLAVIGYGNDDPVAAGKRILEALEKPGATGRPSELSSLGFKKIWLVETRPTLTAKEFEAISEIFARQASCEPPPTPIIPWRIGFMRSQEIVPKYLATLDERAQQEGAAWFWKNTEALINFQRAILRSDTAVMNQMLALWSLEKIVTFLKEKAMPRSFLAKTRPVDLPALFDLRSEFRALAEAGERYELRSVMALFDKGRINSALGDEPPSDRTSWILENFFFRPLQTANDHWDWAHHLISMCDRPEPDCIGEMTSYDPPFSPLNPFGHQILKSFAIQGQTMATFKRKLATLAEHAKALN